MAPTLKIIHPLWSRWAKGPAFGVHARGWTDPSEAVLLPLPTPRLFQAKGSPAPPPFPSASLKKMEMEVDSIVHISFFNKSNLRIYLH